MSRTFVLGTLAGATAAVATVFARRGARRLHATSATTVKVVRS